MQTDIKLELRNISKSFPGVKALDGVSFKVRRGTTHVLCGENGAGKSTLMKIINGIYTPDEGEILLDGKPVKIDNPIHARLWDIAARDEDQPIVDSLVEIVQTYHPNRDMLAG